MLTLVGVILAVLLGEIVVLALAERRRLVAALAEQARTGPVDRSAWYEAQWAAGPDDELAERLGRLGENELADRLLLRAAATWQLAHSPCFDGGKLSRCPSK